MKNVIFFDLDGTLTESGEGITKSVQYALEKLGKPEPDLEKLKQFVGPPLLSQFAKFAGFDPETCKKAVELYRERYATIGIFENSPYPYVEEMLQTLKAEGKILAIASSKPEYYVRQILDHFHLTAYFQEIVGSTMTEKRTDKGEVIEEAIKRLHLEEKKEQIVMVGDKEHDMIGAEKMGISRIGVTYGYGTYEELEKEEPDGIVASVQELLDVLLEFKNAPAFLPRRD